MGLGLQAKSSGTDVVQFGCEKHPQRAEVLLLCAQELLGREPMIEGTDRYLQETAVGALPLTWRTFTWETPLSLGKTQQLPQSLRR